MYEAINNEAIYASISLTFDLQMCDCLSFEPGSSLFWCEQWNGAAAAFALCCPLVVAHGYNTLEERSFHSAIWLLSTHEHVILFKCVLWFPSLNYEVTTETASCFQSVHHWTQHTVLPVPKHSLSSLSTYGSAFESLSTGSKMVLNQSF